MARFPAPELEALVVKKAVSLQIIRSEHEHSILWESIERIEVGRRKVVVQYHLTHDIEPALIEHHRLQGHEIDIFDRTLPITMPVHLKKRGGRNMIAAPSTGQPVVTSTVDLTLLKAL